MALFNEQVENWISKYTSSKQHDISERIIALNTLEDLVTCQRDVDRLTPFVKGRLYPIIGNLISVDWALPNVRHAKPAAAKGPITDIQSGYNHAVIKISDITVKVDVKGKLHVTKHKLPSDSKTSSLKAVMSNVNNEESSILGVGVKTEETLEVNTKVGNPNSGLKPESTCTQGSDFTRGARIDSESLNVNVTRTESVVNPTVGLSSGQCGIAEDNTVAKPVKGASSDSVLEQSDSSTSTERIDFQRSEKIHSTRVTFVINGKDWVKPYSVCAKDVKSFPTFGRRGLLVLNHSNCGATHSHLHIPDVFDSSRIVGEKRDRINAIRTLVEKSFTVVTNNPEFGQFV